MVWRCRGFAKRVAGSAEHFEFGKIEAPAKRRRALLESNPLRNTRRELIAWPDGKFIRTLRPAVFREPRNRFPVCLENSGAGLCGVVRCRRRVVGRKAAGPRPTVYRCCWGGPTAPGSGGDTGCATACLLFESSRSRFPSARCRKQGCERAGLAARAFGQREVLLADTLQARAQV